MAFDGRSGEQPSIRQAAPYIAKLVRDIRKTYLINTTFNGLAGIQQTNLPTPTLTTLSRPPNPDTHIPQTPPSSRPHSTSATSNTPRSSSRYPADRTAFELTISSSPRSRTPRQRDPGSEPRLRRAGTRIPRMRRECTGIIDVFSGTSERNIRSRFSSGNLEALVEREDQKRVAGFSALGFD
ncbi:hypothetical protein NEOLEDRAFT_1177974 [Neolentinus lepideus HHB14362 ss-1]|uniref:Uncharacterized protein n=1 Tax=Neolentinus lepideus HHB14362 ss-1 TaxID=1314782 RepID=A0A165SX99_9AGAM|nr:hypothetical protein NEOLEDRAFT_1177974 [Neolentinus lepideus HHB14362 ss-1]